MEEEVEEDMVEEEESSSLPYYPFSFPLIKFQIFKTGISLFESHLILVHGPVSSGIDSQRQDN